MTPTTFVETSKNKVHTRTTDFTVSREPATFSNHRMERARWFDYVGDHVTSCFKVTVTTKTEHSPAYTETYFEIVTPSGKGVIIDFQSGSELMSFIPNDGSKALIYGCWKKYGSYRGHAVGYLRANRLNPNSKSKVEHSCPAHLYAVASGKKWG
jgi:hypothetical protein